MVALIPLVALSSIACAGGAEGALRASNAQHHGSGGRHVQPDAPLRAHRAQELFLMPAKAGTDAEAESISGSESRCPGERPGKRQLKAWLDTVVPTLLTGDGRAPVRAQCVSVGPVGPTGTA